MGGFFDGMAMARAIGEVWVCHVRACGLLSAEGELMVAEGSVTGWIRFRMFLETDISKIVRNDGNIEFIARSMAL